MLLETQHARSVGNREERPERKEKQNEEDLSEHCLSGREICIPFQENEISTGQISDGTVASANSFRLETITQRGEKKKTNKQGNSLRFEPSFFSTLNTNGIITLLRF